MFNLSLVSYRQAEPEPLKRALQSTSCTCFQTFTILAPAVTTAYLINEPPQDYSLPSPSYNPHPLHPSALQTPFDLVRPTPPRSVARINAMSSTRPFLSLPAEVRNSIYDYCNPISAPVSSYAGLLLSCKKVHSELPVQALKSFNVLIKSVEKNLAAKSCHVTISHPSTFTNYVPDGIGYISLTIGNIRTQLPYDLADMLAPLLSSHYMHFMVTHTHVANNPYEMDLRHKIDFLIARGIRRT